MQISRPRLLRSGFPEAGASAAFVKWFFDVVELALALTVVRKGLYLLDTFSMAPKALSVASDTVDVTIASSSSRIRISS